MKVLTVLGSPRKKGNSSSIAKAFSNKAQELGADVTSYNLNSLNYKGCQGCYMCKTKTERCAVQDELSQVLDAHYEADIVVWASPVYYFTVSGQLKTFIDRTFSFMKPDYFDRPDPSRLPGGKKGLVIISQGERYHVHADVAMHYEMFMDMYGFNERQTIRAVEIDVDMDPAKQAPYVEQAQAIAQEWLG